MWRLANISFLILHSLIFLAIFIIMESNEHESFQIVEGDELFSNKFDELLKQ
jgi:hypothetical protein